MISAELSIVFTMTPVDQRRAGTAQNASTHTERLVLRNVANRTCSLEAGYRVIRPDQFSSLFVSRPQYACTETGQADGTVEPIAVGS